MSVLAKILMNIGTGRSAAQWLQVSGLPTVSQDAYGHPTPSSASIHLSKQKLLISAVLRGSETSWRGISAKWHRLPMPARKNCYRRSRPSIMPFSARMTATEASVHNRLPSRLGSLCRRAQEQDMIRANKFSIKIWRTQLHLCLSQYTPTSRRRIGRSSYLMSGIF